MKTLCIIVIALLVIGCKKEVPRYVQAKYALDQMLAGWQGGFQQDGLRARNILNQPDAEVQDMLLHRKLLEYRINYLKDDGDQVIGTVNLTLEGLPQVQCTVVMTSTPLGDDGALNWVADLSR